MNPGWEYPQYEGTGDGPPTRRRLSTPLLTALRMLPQKERSSAYSSIVEMVRQAHHRSPIELREAIADRIKALQSGGMVGFLSDEPPTVEQIRARKKIISDYREMIDFVERHSGRLTEILKEVEARRRRRKSI